MISLKMMLAMSFLAWVAVFVVGYLYLLFVAAIRWIDRQQMPEANELAFVRFFVRFADEHCGHPGHIASYEEFPLGMCVIGFLLFIALAILSVCVEFGVMRLVVGGALSIAGVMYALRWGRDTQKSIIKVKETVHDHGTDGGK